MKIVVREDDQIVMVADCAPPVNGGGHTYTVHDIPGWDWSLANLTGIDRSQIDWLKNVRFNGTTIVPR